MKGTDITPEQLSAAEHFVKSVMDSTRNIPDSLPIAIRFDRLIRLVAWYGAIRFASAVNGGTLNQPGEVHIVDHRNKR